MSERKHKLLEFRTLCAEYRSEVLPFSEFLDNCNELGYFYRAVEYLMFTLAPYVPEKKRCEENESN